jgi:glucan phosphoethanolaminetransferase (alkaline phosphatase superfamily)
LNVSPSAALPTDPLNDSARSDGANSARGEAGLRATVWFSLVVPFVAAAVWSLIECLDLQLAGAVGLSSPGRVALFWVTHLAIGIAACMVLLAFLTEATAVASKLLRRRARSPEHAIVLGTMLVLFVFHVTIWLVACALGLYTRSNKVVPLIGGPVLCALAAWMFRRHFVDRARRGDKLRALVCFATLLLAHLLNRAALPKQYFLFHVAATLFALTAALLGVGCILRPPVRRPGARARAPLVIAVVVTALIAPFVLFSISNDVRHQLFNTAFDAKALIYLARKLPGAGSDLATADLAAPTVAGATPHLPVPGSAHHWADRVLLITIDTLRRDHLPTYGYGRDTAPAIKAFSDQATTFDWAWAEGPATNFGVAAILGHQPQRSNLPAALRAAGRKQSAISTSRLGFAVDRTWMLDAFDKVITVEREDDLEIARAAVGEIDAGRFYDFMWVHLMAPHDPYEDHADNAFGGSEMDRYDREILESDRAVGQLLQALDRNGLAARTAVVICSDHGEEFGEHGGNKHGTDVFSEVLRIPLMIRVPGLPPHRSPVNVSQQDLPLTMADLLGGIPIHWTGTSRSLVPLLTGGDFDHDRPVIVPPFSTFLMGSVIQQNWKLNFSLFNGSYALYDLAADPGEKVTLFEARPEVASRLLSLTKRLSTEVVSSR